MAVKAKDAQTLTLADGRELGYAIYGPTATSLTPTIFYFHGFPGARIEGALLMESSLAPKIDVQMVAIDRPGMGISSFQPNRRVTDFSADVLALADHLEIKKFSILAISGGAPYALACARDIPRSRLLSTAVVSGIYPGSREGMLFGIRATLFMGYWMPTRLMAKIFDRLFGTAARDPDPKVMQDLFMKEMQGRPAADLKCLEHEEVRTALPACMAEAFRQDSIGVAWDCRLYGDWGFELKEVSGQNVTLWHGGQDINAPAAMAQRASKELVGSTLRVIEHETHMSLPYNNMERIMKELLGNQLSF